MKNYFTKMMALACMFLLGTNAWADTHTIAWNGSGDSNFTHTYGTVTVGGDEIVSFSTEDNDGNGKASYYSSSGGYLSLYFGKNNSGNGNQITFNIGWGVTITGFEITTSTASGSYANATLKYTIDEKTTGTVSTRTQNQHKYYQPITGLSATSSLKIQNADKNRNNVKIGSIKITYTVIPATATTTTIDASGINNTDLASGLSAGSLSATVTPGNGTVTWSSDDDEVATIDANTGAVTLHEEGIVNLTATFAGSFGSTNYKPSKATYQMTVTDSTPQPDKWEEVAFTSLQPGDVFVIVGTYQDNTYALPHDGGSSSAPTPKHVNIGNGRIEGKVADKLKWNLTVEGSGNNKTYTFHPNGDTSTWLYTYASATDYNFDKNSLRVGKNANRNKFVLNNNNCLVTKESDASNYKRYVCLYTNTYTNDFEWAAIPENINHQAPSEVTPIKFYKHVMDPSVNITITSVGYSTIYYGEVNLKVPAGVEAYTYTVDGSKLQSNKTYTENDVIPAGTAVVLKGNAGSYSFAITTESGEGDSQNVLKGSDLRAMTVGGNVYYALSTKGGANVGFYWINDNGAAFECPAHKAYLALDGAPTVKAFVFDDDDATGIEGVQEVQEDQGAIYNLAGQRLNKMQKGINIVNGKKILK